MLDAVQLEKRGIPSAVICTDAFDRSALAMAEAHGFPSYPYAIVDHPLGSRTDSEIEAMAREVLPRVRRLLTETDPSEVAV